MLMVMFMEPAVNALANDKAARGINSPVRRLVLVMHVILTFADMSIVRIYRRLV